MKTKKNKKNKKSITKKNVKLTTQFIPNLSKTQITKLLYPITYQNAIDDYNKLKSIECDKLLINSTIGSNFVNFFTAIERLDTKGRRSISFFDVCKNFNKYYNEKYYFRNGIDNVFKKTFFKQKNVHKIFRNLKSFYTLYMGNVGIFRPAIAKYIICKYKPTKILDFTMGWGGRLMASCIENVDAYIGVDMNTHLKPLYKKMTNALKTLSNTKIKLFFKDALKVDYSKLDYNFVLTSPPYYNIEIYKKNEVLTKEQWNETFYIPLFTETYKYLKRNGYYCLNVPVYIYENVCIKLFGKYNDKIPIGRPKRLNDDLYNEYVYIWKK
jgi:hypothetical protein